MGVSLVDNRLVAYRISANSFFFNLTLCTVTFDYSTYRCGNYSRKYGIYHLDGQRDTFKPESTYAF